MMTVEQAEQVVDLCLLRAREFWLLPSYWRIETRYGKTQGTRPAEIYVQGDYYHAEIIFDLEQLISPRDLYETTAHEFAHIITCDYDHLVKRDKNAEYLCEQLTTRLEHVFLAKHPFDM
jgi:hypothetical protein